MDQEPTKESVGAPPADSQPLGGVDPQSLILPTKEIHSPLNAQRANASVLVANEQSAVLPKPPPLPPVNLGDHTHDTLVRPLETYQGDIERYVRDKNVSTVTVASAEERRRDRSIPNVAATGAGSAGAGVHSYQLLAILGGIFLVSIAGGVSIYAYISSKPFQQKEVVSAEQIHIDASRDVMMQQADSKALLMDALQRAKGDVRISTGLVAQLRVVLASSTGTLVSAQEFLFKLVPTIPPQLLRTVQPLFLLGVHSLDTNQAFLLLSVDSYQGGYAGMLAWEKTVSNDLSPLFEYVPTPQLQATSNTIPRVLESPFVDTVVENHDTRALKNAYGDLVLLWTFLDRSTILITTNQNTVREIITRLKKAPTLLLPER